MKVRIVNVLAALTLMGCASPSSSSVVDDGMVLVSSTIAVANGYCAKGGIRTQVGIDGNGNDVLDKGEVTSTTHICEEGSKEPLMVSTFKCQAGINFRQRVSRPTSRSVSLRSKDDLDRE